MGNLTIQIPVLGSPSFEEDARAFVENVREKNTIYAQDFLHSCYRNVLFNYGIQWITFDTLTKTWRTRANKKWLPKPVTNKYAAVLRPLVSALAGTDPILHFSPMSDQPIDQATASVANRCLDIAREEVSVNYLRPQLARWLLNTGNAWLISGYDTEDAGEGMVPQQMEQCVSCGQTMSPQDVEQEGGCPFCLKAGRESEGFIPAMDNGNPMMGERPRGKLFSELATVFEMEFDREADSFDKSLYACRIRSRDKQWAKARFGLSDEELTSSGDMDLHLIQRRYLESLAYVTPLSYQLFIGRTARNERCVVTDLWLNPTAENPEGCYAIFVGKHLIYANKYEYHDFVSDPVKPRPMRPITHFGYEYAPGRVTYRTPADDLVMKQTTRNELESIKVLHSRRAAGAVWMIPDGSNISKVTGEEGLFVRFTAMSGVPAPTRQPGIEIPRFIDNWMEAIDKEMMEIGGISEVMQGQTPPGVEAYSAIQFLEAKANQALSEPRVLWHAAWAKWSTQVLSIFKEYCVDERETALRGENGTWAVEKFSGADLRGGVHIMPETSMEAPSSMIAKRAAYEQGVRIGLADLADPQERFRGWEMLGIPEVMKDMDLDTQAAARENDMFVAIFVRGEPGAPPQANPVVDNNLVHLSSHRRFAITTQFETLGPYGKQAFYGHMAQHQWIEQQKQIAAMGGTPKPLQQEGMMGVQEGKMAAMEGGAASQPERANEAGKPAPRGRQERPKGERETRLAQVQSEQNAPAA